MADLPLDFDDPRSAARLVASAAIVVLTQPDDAGMQA
jgi:hypothetical protein